MKILYENSNANLTRTLVFADVLKLKQIRFISNTGLK